MSLLTLVCAPTAYADGTDYAVESTADLIAEVAPDAGAVVEPDVVGSAIVAQTDGAQVIVPVEANGGIVIRSDDAPALVPPVVVTLPQELSVEQARVADDGTILFLSEEKSGSDVAVQVLDDGSMRIETVTNSPEGGLEFTYDFGDVELVPRTDGTVDVIQVVDSDVAHIEATVGMIEPAWAVDANGDSVDTWYEVTPEGALLQVINPSEDTEYPVVADPTVSWTWQGINVWFNRAETRSFANQWVNLGSYVGAFIPITQVSAALLGGANLAASWAYNAGMCLKWTWPNALVSFSRYSGGYCR